MKYNCLFILFLLLFSISTVSAQTESAPVEPVLFSVERGFFEAPFTVTLSADPSAQIYYTTDGTRPTTANTLYSSPILITTTTPLSAIAITADTTSLLVSNTYFFISDIVNQPANPAGYPNTWGPLNLAVGNYAAGQNAPADYEMDPEVCNHPAYKNWMKEAFLSIPTVCLVTNPGYIFSHSTDPDTGGIYIYTGDTGNPASNGGGKLGDEWERPASLEFYDPATGKQFQINCGLRLHGGNSRKPYNSGKHSFRVSFRKEYGIGKLRYDFFEEESAVTRFDHIVFRAGYNYSWTKNSDLERLNAQYIYDSFAKETQLNMGYIAVHDRFVHLFINGLYWGLYDASEKINDNFLDSYLGGADIDYDVINDDGLVDGNLVAYNEMLSLAKNGKYDELIAKNLLYMENFIDYMLMNFYIGNMDWGKNNWFTGRSRVTPGYGFQFFSWDAENCMTDVNLNRITTFEGPLREMLFGSSSGSSTNGGLFKNTSFKQLFANRVNLHFTNGGALTPEKTAELYQKLAGEIDLPVILESARWGDFRKEVMPHNNTKILYTRNDHWLPRKQDLLANYFPKRTNIVLNQLKSLGLPAPTNMANPILIDVYFANDNLYYSLPESGMVAIEIFTPDGRMFTRYKQEQTAGNQELPLHLKRQGIYIYRIQFNNTVHSGKFIK
jgi:hypothetical protein